MKKDHSLALLLDIAKLPRSTYYYWQLKFEDPSYTDLDPRLALVADEFDRHHGVYGYRRIRYELRDKDHHFSRKTVYHLLKAAGRRCKSRVKRYSSFRGTPGQVAPNIVARRFDRNQANHLWLTDVTMFQAAGRRVYLSAIKDVFNGEIVGHSVATSPTVRFVMRSLDNALATRTFGADLIIHSDQGLQYQHTVISQRNTRTTTRAVLPCNKHAISLRIALTHLHAAGSITSLHPVVARHLIDTFIGQSNAL